MKPRYLFNLFVCIAVLLISFPVQVSQGSSLASEQDPLFNSQETRGAPQMSPLVQICGNYSYDTDVAYNRQRDEYLVVCEKADGITGRRVSSRGEVQGDAFNIIQTSSSGKAENPRVAYDDINHRYLVIWFYKANVADTESYVMGRITEWDGSSTTGAFQISENDRLAVGDEHLGDLAFAHTAGEFLVVWASSLPTDPDWIIGRPIPADGSSMLMGSYMIAFDSSYNLANPAVAYNLARNQYLVVYDNGGDVFGRRLNASGTQLGGVITIANWSSTECEPAVAACHSADQYLVGWHSLETPSEGVYTRFINWDGTIGTVLNPMHRDDQTISLDIAIDCGKTDLLMESPNYLVAWAGGSTFGQSESGARMVETSGSMSDAVTINDSITGKVAVAGGRINFLAATSESTLTMNHMIYARIVGNTKPVAGFTVAPAQGDTTTKFKFDASSSTDATDNDADLLVRWDWTNDGVFDTTWTKTKTAEHVYDYLPLILILRDVNIIIRLEVKDGNGETDKATGTVLVKILKANDTYESYLPILLR